MAEIISFYDLYRMATGEATSYTNYSNSQGDTNLDPLGTGKGRLDLYQGALSNTTEDADYRANYANKKADTNNMVDGKRHWSTANPIIAAKMVNSMYKYAGESAKDYLKDDYDPFEGMTNEEIIAEAGHRSTYSDYYKEKEAKEGGFGSGRLGHQDWMRDMEYGGGYVTCPDCAVFSPKEDNKCSICGHAYI